jgi:hypothetical protein
MVEERAARHLATMLAAEYFWLQIPITMRGSK